MPKTKVRLTIDSHVKDEREHAKLAELHQMVVSHVMSLDLRECVKVTMEYDLAATAESADSTDDDALVWTALSERQRQIAKMLCHHYSVKRIADELYVSVNTVKKHIQNMKKALNLELSGADFIYALQQMMKQGAAGEKNHTLFE